MADNSKPRVPCEQYGKTFASQGSLNKYAKFVHSEQRPHACTKGCNKRFKKKDAAHERIHTLERPFQCEQCSKCFYQAGHLTVHRRTHTGERPYQCEECGKGFRHQHHLASHSRTHTGEKPYKCEFCDYRCSDSSNIIKHERAKHADEFNALQAAFMGRGGLQQE